MASQHTYDIDSVATDSVASSPRSDYMPSNDSTSRVRFMCSFGGKILPRPSDNQLRYVGGDTRIVAFHRSTTFATLLTKLSKLAGTLNMSVKYQLPNEDLDSLISVTTDEDVENMMDEYDRLAQSMSNTKAARLRLFLFTKGTDETDQSQGDNSISSLLEGSAKREHWFVDALNSGGPGGGGAGSLDRGRSEVSSIVSEVPDYLFGLDNSDEGIQLREPKPKSRLAQPDNISASDPGSPAPVVSSPVAPPSMPELRPVKTKPDNLDPVSESKSQATMTQAQPTGYSSSPAWHYAPGGHHSGQTVQPVPVYYVSSPVQHGNYRVQHVPMGAPAPQYVVQQYPTVHSGHFPVGYNNPDLSSGSSSSQGYNGEVRPIMHMGSYDVSSRVHDGVNQQQFYYGPGNTGMVSGYPGAMGQPREDVQSMGADTNRGRANP